MYSTSVVKMLLIALFVVLSGANGDGPDISDIQRAFERSRPGYMVCYYYGSMCRRDSQVCSPKVRACMDLELFPKDATDQEKCVACKNFIAKTDNALNDTVTASDYHGYYDACLYIIGKLAAQNKSVCCGVGQTLTRKVGYELCPFSNTKEVLTQCKLGEEYCTSAGCKPLFVKDATDETKRAHCENVIRRNETQQVDPCIYALGLLQSTKSNQTKNPADSGTKAKSRCSESQPPQAETGPYIMIGVLGTLLVVVIIVAVAAVVCLCKVKKWACFKKQRKTHVTKPLAGGNDVDRREKFPMMENDENRKREKAIGRKSAPADTAEGANQTPQEDASRVTLRRE